MSPSKPAQPIRLHTTLLSGHGHRVKLFLTLLDLPFTINELNMAAGDNRKPAHLALNPLGEVPVIEDGDVVLSDSNAILVYLARKYGDPSWLPQDPLGAAAVQRWLSLAAGKIAYGPCAARLVTVFGAPHHLETAQKIAVKLFDVLDAELRDKPFAIGDTPTIADIAAHSYIAHAPEGGISLEPYPHIRAWLKRIEALPRFLPMPASKAGLVAEID
ncbi:MULTISPECIES: glutathione S-transferase family protein [Paraburkholderia]|jgi:glutathione S-transferase|uniref:Glutathione S-transferase n=1 Tax=Paraburkholderia phenazinium TaxID=60549 RepID=A0A1N6HGI2_9BURK|nr:glutathione S-transferase [Paraburkholderia phenazinium]SIO18769.1 glutathione S-transferase [Paraburkholderia phenazinium]